MTDIVLSSFLSLFALFGKEEKVDETRARNMLVSYLQHHFGIRNISTYLDLYSDMRAVYEMSDTLDTDSVVASICNSLHGRIRAREEAMLLLRIMEFCGLKGGEEPHPMFRTMASAFKFPDSLFNDCVDFVSGRSSERVKLFQPEGFEGTLKTLLTPSGTLVFTYIGDDKVLLNDVPVLSGAYQVWLQSSVLKGKGGQPVYYSTILSAYSKQQGTDEDAYQQVELCGRDINFRFPQSDNGIHNLSFTLRSGELMAVMGGSGTGKSTLLSL